jgi:pyruvate dehydrogenase E1 component beta subunit
MAEGAHDPVPVFGTLPTPADGIAAERIIEMPTSENAIVGAAIGAALAGKRPVVTFHRVEFALLAAEQIVNNAAKMEFISNGRHKVPLLLRLVVGRGWGQGPVHAQSLESLFAAIPGLTVAMPATAHDAYTMTRQALRGDGPVVLIEHRWCYGLTGEIDYEDRSDAFAGPTRISEGDALTIVATGYMTVEARRAADALRKLGHPVDVFDLRTLRPLCVDPILRSTYRTTRLLTVDTGQVQYGIGAELVSRCAEAETAVTARRIGLPDRPVSSSRHLLSGHYPDALDIFKTAVEMLGVPGLGFAPPGSPIDQPDPTFTGPF